MAIFGKSGAPRDPEGEKSRATTPPVPGIIRPRAAEAPVPRMEARTSVIGPQVRIHGELSAEEDIVVEGRIEGEISVTQSLKIGPGAQVNAEVKAQSVIIAGRVVGNVTATERVELLPSGSLEGNIRAPKIIIAEGAQFRGSVDMGSRASGAASEPAAEER
jgi:cytoskeletal protein CcmA (bactofilin family)